MASASFLTGISLLEDVHSLGRKGKEEERGTGRMLGNLWPESHLVLEEAEAPAGRRAAATGWAINNRFIKAIQTLIKHLNLAPEAALSGLLVDD